MKNSLLNIIQDKNRFARLLNTLSFLEYIGARKILKSQLQDQIDEKILSHAQEELRHAQVLKKAALKIAPGLCETYAPETLLCGPAAGRYFQAIDHVFSDLEPWHAYLYTTWVIEERALVFYNLIDEVLVENNKPAIFRGILVEEENHLADILADLALLSDSKDRMEMLKAIEEREFQKFFSALAGAPCLAVAA